MRMHEIRLHFHRVAWLAAAALVFVLILTAAPASAQSEPGFAPVVGKWSRGAADSVAWVDLANWKLVTQIDGRPSIVSSDPQPNPWVPVAGDLDGDGVDSVLMFQRPDLADRPAREGADRGLQSGAQPLGAGGRRLGRPWA